MVSDIWAESQATDSIANIVSAQMSPDINPGAIKKRSVILEGHRTSVSLENAFWSDLKKFAAQRGLTVNQLVTEIDQQRTGNLSSAIRVFVLRLYQQPKIDL
ncbi:MAG: ribbon-helix-helix domain-containing protein [Alphaproteobacteria bacterium]